jgi:hypothetical protein
MMARGLGPDRSRSGSTVGIRDDLDGRPHGGTLNAKKMMEMLGKSCFFMKKLIEKKCFFQKNLEKKIDRCNSFETNQMSSKLNPWTQ